MNYQLYIKELHNASKTLEINHMIWWLMKYEDEFYKTILTTNCGKWQKWYYKNEIPFPCACHVRNIACLFLEIYYELEKLVQLNEKQEYFENVVKEYKQLSNNKREIIKWTIKNKSMGKELLFSTKLNFKFQAEPYESLEVNINPKDFKYVLEFQNIFDKEYYVEKQTNINQ